MKVQKTTLRLFQSAGTVRDLDGTSCSVHGSNLPERLETWMATRVLFHGSMLRVFVEE